jgi:2-isopropylmalate synthase
MSMTRISRHWSTDEAGSVDDRIKLVDMEVVSKTGGVHHCDLAITIDGVEVKASFDGTGSVDAIFNAIKQAVGKDPHLVLYAIERRHRRHRRAGERPCAPSK